jgi:hypothetical protein
LSAARFLPNAATAIDPENPSSTRVTHLTAKANCANQSGESCRS